MEFEEFITGCFQRQILHSTQIQLAMRDAARSRQEERSAESHLTRPQLRLDQFGQSLGGGKRVCRQMPGGNRCRHSIFVAEQGDNLLYLKDLFRRGKNKGSEAFP